MFNELVVSSAIPGRTLKRWTVLLSAIGQAVALGVLILIPLIYTEALPSAVLRMTLLAPAPPAPPAAPAPTRTPLRAALIPPSRAGAPVIPLRTVPSDAGSPPVLGAEQGIVGSTGTTLTDLIPLSTPPAPAQPMAEPRPQRIRSGGTVVAALLVDRVVPSYPAIAQAAHVAGTIVLHAIIATDGSVQELSYISGPPLLMKAAMDAVRQWRYRPTLLNGEPVEVETTIDVVFNLGG